MGLLISRIVLTLILIYMVFLVWTKNVDLRKWVQNKMPITEDKVSQAVRSDVEIRELAEGNRGLLENLVTNKHEKDLQSKYPGGYTLFGIDHSRTFENRSIPHRSNVLEEYEFDWRPVRISEVTETNVTIEFPHIHYKPLDTNLFSTAMIIPKSPKGESYRYPVRPEGTKNRIFCELVEYKNSFYVFAIGFKPVGN